MQKHWVGAIEAIAPEIERAYPSQPTTLPADHVPVRCELAEFLEEAFGDSESVLAGPKDSKVTRALVALIESLMWGKTVESCLRTWSRFIRERDGHRCVLCSNREGLCAHHICRKSFLPYARFQTGNGITLCRKCHVDIHEGFNGRPDLRLPMDAQGGEKIETMLFLYGALLQNARGRDILDDQHYYLSNSTLRTFKLFQGFPPETDFAGCRLEQAYRIWRATPQSTLKAILKANGLPLLPTEVFTGMSHTTPNRQDRKARAVAPEQVGLTMFISTEG